LNRPSHVWVADPNPASLANARSLFHQHSDASLVESVEYLQGLDGLPPHLDVAVIATAANKRRGVIELLLERCHVQYLVLEKFLFQNVRDYEYVKRLFENAGARAWVNCPRRLWPAYRRLKGRLSEGPLDYRVTGSAWGLGCNAIHFLDHVAYLTGDLEYVLDSQELENEVFPSRRNGFVEFSGRIRGKGKSGTQLELVCSRTGDAPILVSIFSSEITCVINETARTGVIADRENEWRWEQFDVSIPYQSELTSLVVQRLLDTGECELTPYAQSAILHVNLLKRFTTHYQDHFDKDAKLCPIT